MESSPEICWRQVGEGVGGDVPGLEHARQRKRRPPSPANAAGRAARDTPAPSAAKSYRLQAVRPTAARAATFAAKLCDTPVSASDPTAGDRGRPSDSADGSPPPTPTTEPAPPPAPGTSLAASSASSPRTPTPRTSPVPPRSSPSSLQSSNTPIVAASPALVKTFPSFRMAPPPLHKVEMSPFAGERCG